MKTATTASADWGVLSNIEPITAWFGHCLLYSLLYISPWSIARRPGRTHHSLQLPCCSFILLLSLALMRSVCCAALHVVTVQHRPIRGRHPPVWPMRGSPRVMMNVQTGEWRLEWVWRGSMESDGRSSFSTDSARNTENTENTGLQRHRAVKNIETVTGEWGV